MPSITERSLIRFGQKGLAITLPKAWVDYYQLKPGDKVTVVANRRLVIKPLTTGKNNGLKADNLD
jgi:bifunctional DNA-binding transcriptional regulator/antitoxin component of YhaV-PrlF toxin-antitoxin module